MKKLAVPVQITVLMDVVEVAALVAIKVAQTDVQEVVEQVAIKLVQIIALADAGQLVIKVVKKLVPNVVALVLMIARNIAAKVVLLNAVAAALVLTVQAIAPELAKVVVLVNAKVLVQKHVLIIAKEVAINLTVWVVVVVDAKADAEELVVVHATVQRSNLCK